jgi:hypothetical protein
MTDASRADCIREYLRNVEPEVIRKYQYKPFKLRMPNGEMAFFEPASKWNAYLWWVKFKRSTRKFRAAWNIGSPSVVYINMPSQA